MTQQAQVQGDDDHQTLRTAITRLAARTWRVRNRRRLLPAYESLRARIARRAELDLDACRPREILAFDNVLMGQLYVIGVALGDIDLSSAMTQLSAAADQFIV